MTESQTKAVAKLRQQQSKHAEGSAPWTVAAQLIDICSRDPRAAEIILPDLDNAEMDIVSAEKQIKSFADEKHKTVKGSCVCVTPYEAEVVLRKFFGLPVCGDMPAVGLPDADAAQAVPDALPVANNTPAPAVTGSFLDFL